MEECSHQRRLPRRLKSEASLLDLVRVQGADSDSVIQQYDNGDVQSLEPENAMMVDPPEYVDSLEMDEKDEVAIINPDQLDGETPEKPRADDCKFGRSSTILHSASILCADICCSCCYESYHIPTDHRTAPHTCRRRTHMAHYGLAKFAQKRAWSCV